ncbi:hypothetical protein NDU88_006989 [Pleurodeles waltl]|uniref:Uncharacterized protein n=1 Tax=Pleurodeles waltl TaxID=8319 RepID=A0AAV7TZ59_PLEWA|nr:hypothetical protein NDU88_006989 [Pleurodeles waltl]
MQGLQPMQQVQMPRVQPVQIQQVQQQIPVVPRLQMQLPLAPMGQQQVMLPQQFTGQGMSPNNAVQQFPLRGKNGIKDEWSDESSDGEECRLTASLEVDQRGPYLQGKVMGHKVSFLVDTGATHSTLRSAEVQKLPLSGCTIKVVGVANQLLTNLITDPVQVEIGTFQGLHRFVVFDSSPETQHIQTTSLRNPNMPGEVRFNEAPGRTQQAVEQALRPRKVRLSCQDRTGGALFYSPGKVCQIIVACCSLHNITLQRSSPYIPEEREPTVPQGENPDLREDFIHSYFL